MMLFLRRTLVQQVLNAAFITPHEQLFTPKLFDMIKKLNAVYKSYYTKRIKYAISICLLLAIAQLSMGQQTKKVNTVCDVTKGEMKEVEQQVSNNIKKLKAAGKLDFKKYRAVNEVNNTIAAAAATNILFRWPMTTAAYRDFASWHITNFVDLDPDSFNDGTDRNPNEIGDYNCGDRTYDGHGGIDICIDPYRWELKNNGFIKVVAAADGIIVFKHQGEFDENCGSLDVWQGSTGRGNNLVILHQDGTTASFYMHMKDGSLTSKEEGDFIYAGDYIGTVASAGRSSEPHLHFQVNTGYVDSANGNDETGARIDPFVGTTCSESAATSWINQLPYNDPAVLTLETHGTAPGEYSDVCDKIIPLDFDNSFVSGQSIWLRSAFRDWLDGSTITHNIYKPDGTLWRKYDRTNITGSRSYFPLDAKYTFTPSDPTGTYRYTVNFGGKTYSHYFTVGCQASLGLSGAATGHKGFMVSDFISSIQTISGVSTNYIKYMADGHVTLSPGFRATAGCRFVAHTAGCNNSTAAINKAATAETAGKVEKGALTADNKMQSGVRVFPNPSTGVFTIRYGNNQKFSAAVTIRNMLGQVIYAIAEREYEHELQQQVNLTGKPKGIYLVEILSGDKRITSKVLIQ
ncbi:peptidoglycan DD-metalloendopeptidase family protein [Panacibacter sp. KCS-6]|uniref:Peptidoglycan DD-metalloendopeptidase family protein n=2 Tax=Limnovirga soli TaxID=2656915 RepID=A0A8J8FCC2_9BACT|nr:peptidoglycan DD-metalloendopeptidase family protein [Limnovirga soli]